MRRLILLATLAALGACATGGATQTDETTARQAAIFSSPETGTLMTDRPRASVTMIAAPPAKVWLAVKSIYAKFDVPLSVENPGTRQIGNENFFRSRTFAGQPMTALVDCGSGMTGPKAATYRIYMSLLTDVIPDGQGGTKLQTTFVPMGQDLAGGSSDRIPCGTTGRLEQLFLDQVTAVVTGASGKP
jgi:hypothetical protein